MRHLLSTTVCLALAACGCGSSSDSGATAPAASAPTPTATYLSLKRDILINADIWDLQPRMLAAGLGFTEIIGVDGIDLDDPIGSEQRVRQAGGTWNAVTCLFGGTPTADAFTSAITPQQVATTFGYPVTRCDGLPVEFSWPIRPSTLDPTDFVVVLNDGTRVTPQVCSISPNFDFNERAVAVLFGKFGNRLGPDDPQARYPVSIEVVPDTTPLQLIGPGGQVQVAVGLKADSRGTPYTDAQAPPDQRGGPRLVAAKLSRLSALGDDAPALFQNASPNDGLTLYGPSAQYRLRVFTSGGFSPDGVRGVFPTEFSRYFRLQAVRPDGSTVLLTESNVPYDLGDGRLTVLGLAELGKPADGYDDCYIEDQDNQIDIILSGDLSAARRLTFVDVPAVAPYSPFYNPGGPGNRPTPGVRYSAPSPPHSQAILQALDDPLTVTFIDPGIPTSELPPNRP